ncbi:MAG: NAD(P)-dependent oxidoreductase, partial [Oscillospiraceae bacterium]
NKTVLTRDILSQCKNVKFIGLFATGYNVIDIEYCKENSIVVSNAPAYSTNSVAQLVFAMMMQFFNLVNLHDEKVHKGDWENCKDFCFYDQRISELANKTIGIIGFGNIGKKVAKIAKAFDMNVLVYSRTKYPRYVCDQLNFVSLDELLANSDIVTIHCPLFPETIEMINKETINKMKKTALLINTSRGGLINETDLANALNNQDIAGACVDVVTVEPIATTNPLLTAKNCIMTPHIAWANKESRARLIEIVVKNVAAFVDDNPINNVADF